MKSSKRNRRVLVSADESGVVSQAGFGLLREMAKYTGLVDTVSSALADTHRVRRDQLSGVREAKAAARAAAWAAGAGPDVLFDQDVAG